MSLRRTGFSPVLSLLMPASALPRAPPVLPVRLLCLWNAPLPEPLSASGPRQSAASVIDLSPDHFRRIVTRPVSYYALFEGWLLLSQPPGCLCDDTSLTTESIFGDLSWRSGLFPFRLRKLALAASLPHFERMPLRSLIRVGRRVGPRALSVLYRTW